MRSRSAKPRAVVVDLPGAVGRFAAVQVGVESGVRLDIGRTRALSPAPDVGGAVYFSALRPREPARSQSPRLFLLVRIGFTTTPTMPTQFDNRTWPGSRSARCAIWASSSALRVLCLGFARTDDNQ